MVTVLRRLYKERATCGFSLLMILALPFVSCTDEQKNLERTMKDCESTRGIPHIVYEKLEGYSPYRSVKCEWPGREEVDSKEKKP
jgi:hypothetical protein